MLNFFLTGMAVWVGWGTYRMVWHTYGTWKEVKDETTEIAALQARKEELEFAIAELSSKNAVEREAKRRLNLKSPGEEVVVVVSDKSPQPGGETRRSTFFERIKRYFGFGAED